MKYRNRKQYTQSELGKQAKMKQSTIAALEKGLIPSFTLKKLAIIATALDVSLDMLLIDSIDKYRTKEFKRTDFVYNKDKLYSLLDNMNDSDLEKANKIINLFIEYKLRVNNITEEE